MVLIKSFCKVCKDEIIPFFDSEYDKWIALEKTDRNGIFIVKSHSCLKADGTPYWLKDDNSRWPDGHTPTKENVFGKRLLKRLGGSPAW